MAERKNIPRIILYNVNIFCVEKVREKLQACQRACFYYISSPSSTMNRRLIPSLMTGIAALSLSTTSLAQGNNTTALTQRQCREFRGTAYRECLTHQGTTVQKKTAKSSTKVQKNMPKQDIVVQKKTRKQTTTLQKKTHKKNAKIQRVIGGRVAMPAKSPRTLRNDAYQNSMKATDSCRTLPPREKATCYLQ
jgi:hypothetical protein